MKLENIDNHNYFVNTCYNILKAVGIDYTFEEIEKKCIKDAYLLYIHTKETGKWHLGIWAVGKWDIKEGFEMDGKTETFDGGYGLEHYEPLSISVFLIHDWTFDKFRPSRSDLEYVIKHNNSTELENVIKDLKQVFKNPLDSYYNIVYKNSYSFQHHESNKYKAYFKGYYRNEIVPTFKKYHRRTVGFISTIFLKILCSLDWRVKLCKYKFHKDKWNAEYDIAIVFKDRDTSWLEWKVYDTYHKLFVKLFRFSKYNINIDFNYIDENGNIPENIWRGIYWTVVPEKDE